MSEKTRKAWEVLEETHEVVQEEPENAPVTAICARAALAVASAFVAFVEAYETVHGTERRGAEAGTEPRKDEGL